MISWKQLERRWKHWRKLDLARIRIVIKTYVYEINVIRRNAENRNAQKTIGKYNFCTYKRLILGEQTEKEKKKNTEHFVLDIFL